jgi:hypothetical protein
MMTSRTRKPRGGAAVETAIMMIALIPLIMYSFYLSDLLFYHLDQDEAVYSTPWDFLSFDYRHIGEKDTYVGDPQPHAPADDKNIPSYVTKAARFTYGDHTSAFNDYSTTDLDKNQHHQALAAHECWLANEDNDKSTNSGQQVTCWPVIKNSIIDTGNPAPNYPNNAALGALTGKVYACRARLGVENYFLPKNFLNFGKKNKAGNVGLTPDLDSTGAEMKRYKSNPNTADVHTNAKGDAYMLPEGNFRVMHDSWALNYVRSSTDIFHYPRDQKSEHVEVDPDKHPLNMVDQDEITRWTMVPFGLFAVVQLKGKPYDFLGKMVSAKFATSGGGPLKSMLGVDGTGDTLFTPPVTFNKVKDKDYKNLSSASDGQYPSGWRDSRAPGMAQGAAGDYLRQPASQW